MTTQKINEYQESNQPLNFRENLTSSQWSHCDRSMWLNLRNCTDIKHKPETIRTFQFGHAVEELIVKWLKDCGFKISCQQGKVLNKWGKYLGSIDGIIFHEKSYKLLEIKSSNSKRFKDWIKNGIPESYKAQVSIYMHHSGQLSTRGNKLTQCLFVVMNKDTSEIHTEVYEYDQQYAQLQTDRIESVIESEAVPAGDESYLCNMCNHKSVCKGDKVAEISCRTCAFVSSVDGEFKCDFGYGKICNNYIMHPQLIELTGEELEEVDHETQSLVFKSGLVIVKEGVFFDGKRCFTSQEFQECKPYGLVNDAFVNGCKEMFGAKVGGLNAP